MLTRCRQLTFKFTRGAIKLNLGKLEYFDKNYRDALLRSPVSELTDDEAKLVDRNLVQPTLRQVESMTAGSTPSAADTLPHVWRDRLELVPALASSDGLVRAAYVRRILAARHGAYQSPATLIQQHPYLFWRVPASLYKQTLSALTPPDQRILAALQDAIDSEASWHGPCAEAMNLIRDRLQGHDISQVVLHKALRLIGAGGPDVVSPSSAIMFMLLGRQEWQHRLHLVRAAMANTL